MAMREPKPTPPTIVERKKLKKMIGAAKGIKVDPMDYLGKPYKKAMGPAKPKRQAPKPKGSGSAGIGENLPKPYKRPKTSGSTSARIRNMEKKYRKKLMEK